MSLFSKIYQNINRNQYITKDSAPYFFISPFYILFSIFLFFPTLLMIFLSFMTWSGGGAINWVGIQNYQTLMQDPTFWTALNNTALILLIQVPLMTFLAVVLAVVLNSGMIKFKSFFRVSLFLPVCLSLVAYSTIALLMFNKDYGLVNLFLTNIIGLNSINWLGNPFWAKITIIISITWRWTGYNMVIALAGLQTIPQQLYEAAEIDGANAWQKFWSITIPQLRPVILFILITSTLGTFKLFAEPNIITDGGPAQATITLVQYIYRMAFRYYSLGYSSAIAVVLVFIVTILSILQLRLGGRDY